KVQFIANTVRKGVQSTRSEVETEESPLVWREDQQLTASRPQAVAAVIGALPLPFPAFPGISWPGLWTPADKGYVSLAKDRWRVGRWLGFSGCAGERVQEGARDEVPPSPLARIGKLTLRLGVTAGVALIFCCVLVDSYNLNLTERLQTEPLEEPPWMRAILQ